METKVEVVYYKHGELPMPTNQYQQAIWYLHRWNEFSLLDVIKDSMFFKFQSRLSEIEGDNFICLANRKREGFINKFGTKSTYNLYSRSVSKEKLAELFFKYAEKIKPSDLIISHENKKSCN